MSSGRLLFVSGEEMCFPADLPVDVAKALGPENLNLRAVAALSHDSAVLRTLGLQPPDGGSGLAAAAADGAALGMAAEDNSDEELDSEDLDYTLDASCTNCTGHTFDGFCQASTSFSQPQGHRVSSPQHELHLPCHWYPGHSRCYSILLNTVVSACLLLGVSAVDACRCQEQRSVDLSVAQDCALWM